MNVSSLQVSTTGADVTLAAVVPGTGTVKLTFQRRFLQRLLDDLNTASIMPAGSTFPVISTEAGAATHTVVAA